MHLLVSLVVRKVQEKMEREGGRVAADFNDEGVGEQQERGVVERVDEKQMEEETEVKVEEKDEDVKVMTESVRSLSL